MHINILLCASQCDQMGKKVLCCHSNMYAALIFLVSLLLHITPSDLASQLSKHIIMCSLVVTMYGDSQYEVREKAKYYI